MATEPASIPASRSAIEAYLTRRFGAAARLRNVRLLGDDANEKDGKEYGYGLPLLIEYEHEDKVSQAVLHTMAANQFGHEHLADRAAILIWSHDTFNRLPRHVRSLDLGAISETGELFSLAGAGERFLLTEYVAGDVYANDIRRLRERGEADDRDRRRADILCDYLVEIHGVKGDQPSLYTRRIRELVGHSECIMGLIDSYPADCAAADPAMLREIEHRVVDWRWRIKDRLHRLRQVHGDFHPWNILFRDDDTISVLDRSRGEFGDPTDDVTSLTLNYVFESLQTRGKLAGGFAELFGRFWQRYLQETGDHELLEVAAPFITFRTLVMASPVWFPDIDESVRERLMALTLNVLKADRFNPDQIDGYLRR